MSLRIKNMINLAEKHATTQTTKKYTFSTIRSRTLSTISSDNKIDPSKNSSLMANTLLWANMILPMPIIASTIYRHFSKGPPAKSWSLTADITIAVLRNFLSRSSKITVEDIQKLSTTKKLPVPSNIQSTKFTVPNQYRKRAGGILSRLFTKDDERCIGWDWEKDRDDAPPIKGEWLQSKGDPLNPSKESTILYLHGGAYYIGCYGIYRHFLSRIIKYSKGRTCAIDYRLAPQHPFPAAVEDALATYLYLIDPPEQDELDPVDPKKIVIAGDSAGGGLTFALLLAIRDAELPTPAGAMTLSPWLDLTHSLPSILSNILTDYLPPTGFQHAPSPALDYAQLPQREKETELLDQLKEEAANPTKESNHTKDMSSIGPFGETVPIPGTNREEFYRVQFYADNEALKLPMVSPLFDRSKLRGLPPLLIQCGSAERLRDESIYASLLASNTFPGSDKDNTTRTSPTKVTLEVYEDQPHVFQLLFSNKATSRAFKNLATFVRDTTSSPATYTSKKQEEQTTYLTDDPICIRHVTAQGKMTDTTRDTLRIFTKSEWAEWEARLSRPSLKERMEDVSRAFDSAVNNVK
ncbi:Alpha/Beta hydrolase protein [Helicostylum pulchrum]|uniref:Alpha/beta hydrolase fold-3 domain-containing protein n=1 Tax=Helicostylum pulchrum TaxID=562976 RepID=A0ABP9Y738_9FUNG|nr:Alpha/Beta hydrolase protein [Helicostylum pulchrum]